MGSQSKTSEKSTTVGNTTSTPTYQEYSTPIMENMAPQMTQAFNAAMQQYNNPQGYSPEQMGVWNQIANQAKQFGAPGPGGQAAAAMQPFMGQGYMQQLDPYFSGMKKEIQGAIPQENRTFWQSMKREMGPMWGTSGRAADQAAEAYGKLRLQQADKMAGLYGQQAQAAQAGAQYTAAAAPTYATLANPYAWGQQSLDWAGRPKTAITEEQAAAQAQALPWSQQLATIAGLGYQYPQSVNEQGTQTSRGSSESKQGGVSCCFIMAEAGDLTDTVRWARDARYGRESIVAEGYKKMAKWLVPLMQKSPMVKFLVKYTMTWPIRKVAEKRIVGRHHPALYPIGFFWEAVWGLYGRI